MRYCTRCVQPDTRPGIFFSEEGICGACLWEDEKELIDWGEREKELVRIASWAKQQKASYDCVVGVSGGKDSTFQALYARDTLGLRPLLVHSEPAFNTETGRANLENLKQLGFDTISLRVNPQVFKKLVSMDFFKILNISRPSEYPLYASACIIADRFDVPLIIQGENAGQTLGTSKDSGTGGDAFNQFKLNTVKTDPTTLYIDNEDILYEDLFMFIAPLEKLKSKGTKSIFLSYYTKEWSQPHNAAFSIQHGLRIMSPDMDPYEYGIYRRFFALDYYYHPMNQLFKYIKFGFGMTTDMACYDLRENIISYDEAIFLVRELDGRCGGEIIRNFCRYIGITFEEFWEHCNTFRGPMWRKNVNKKWFLENPIWEQKPSKRAYSVAEITSRLGM